VKKIAILLFCVSIHSLTFSFFNISPWLITENKTNLSFDCKIEIICDFDSFHEIELTSKDRSDNNIVEIIALQEKQPQENSSTPLIFNLLFTCSPESKVTVNPVFYKDNSKIKNPEIKSVRMKQTTLQLLIPVDIEDFDQRHFIIDQQEDIGITADAKVISIKTRSLYNLDKLFHFLSKKAAYFIGL